MPAAPIPELWVLDHADILGGGQLFAERLLRHVTAVGAAERVRLVCPAGSELAARCHDLPLDIVDAGFPDLQPAQAPAILTAAAHLRRALAPAARDAVMVGNTARVQAYATLASPHGRTARFVHLMHERDSARRASARFVHARFGTLVAVGANAARAYAQALGRPEVRRINNFLDPGVLRAMVAARSPARAGRPVVGALGRLIPEKGILELVNELAAAPDAWAEAIIAGPRQDERYAAEVERQIADLGLEGRVRLIGPVDDLPAFYGGVDALVVPSTGNEAQPTTIIEALAFGRPVVVRAAIASTDFEGLPVAAYDIASELAAVLAELPRTTAPEAVLLERFGPEQALGGLLEAAEAGGVAPAYGAPA